MTEDNINNGGKLNLLVATQDAETVCDWVREALGKEPVEVTKPYATEALLEIYFDSALEAEIARKVLPEGFPIKYAEVSEYREQDWTTFWRHHFHTLEIGGFRIIPEWEKVPTIGKKDIIINPGLSFGTGGHFTTRFCLQALEESFQCLEVGSMIDAGTGSGILAIAAIKLGISQVDAFDYDPVCVTQCLENAQRNDVENRINFFQADVLDPSWLKEPADVVCANILTSVLIEAAPLIIRAAKKRIILSGIREVEADGVADTFVQLGGKEIARDGNGQWAGVVIGV
ncbi:MAG: 50S ribosomal protein L11 methyltransferase [Kiritimatiellales bacterium]|nr:50S ribosomal protein L11 methyltransferase [Kiritimatiellales bacterium]